VAAFHNGRVIGCSGKISALDFTERCFALGPDLLEWKEIFPLPYNPPLRNLASSVVDNKWLISGGFDDRDDINSDGIGGDQHPVKSTLVMDDSLFESGPSMPFAKYYHCQVTLNSTHVFFTSGEAPGSFILNWNTGEYDVVDDVPDFNDYPACGVLNNNDHGQEVLVAGGHDSFIFSFTNLSWREGPKLPESLHTQAAAPTRDGFIAIGGFNGLDGSISHSAYTFQEDSYEWILEEAQLAIPRQTAVAVAVPDDFVNCQ